MPTNFESPPDSLREYRSLSDMQVDARLNKRQEPEPLFATRYYRSEKTTTNTKSALASRICIFRVRSQHAVQEIQDRPKLPTGELWQNSHSPAVGL